MTRMISPDISTWPDADVALVGGVCSDTDCGAAVFPIQELCPRCSKDTVEQTTFPRTGTLIAWTTQGFLPGAPYLGDETRDTFTPFGVGLVQLGDVIRIEGRLTENDPEKLEFGAAVEVTTVPLGHDADGEEVVTFAFQPVGA